MSLGTYFDLDVGFREHGFLSKSLGFFPSLYFFFGKHKLALLLPFVNNPPKYLSGLHNDIVHDLVVDYELQSIPTYATLFDEQKRAS